MRVLLQNKQSKLYYATLNRRVSNPAGALDFHRVPDAAKFALEQKLFGMEIVVNYTEPECEVRLPVLPEWCLLDEHCLLPVQA